MNQPDNGDPSEDNAPSEVDEANTDPRDPAHWPREIGGVRGPEPTRYGDWERNGRCSDF
jgi:hypothetical protein